jgi:hypothetical protein
MQDSSDFKFVLYCLSQSHLSTEKPCPFVVTSKRRRIRILPSVAIPALLPRRWPIGVTLLNA